MEQLSIFDLFNQDKFAHMPSRIAFIDESGSFGFSFDKEGTKRYYVICAVILHSSELKSVEKKFEEICCNNGFSESEMKSSIIGNNHRRRIKILTEILPLKFTLILLIADKEAFIESSPLVDYKEVFVKYLHRRLYETMYAAYPKLSIAEDSFGTSEFQTGYHKYVEANRPKRNLLNEYDFTFVDSKASRLIQLADFIAGSICQQMEDASGNDYLQILRGKITCSTHFPNRKGPYFSNLDKTDDSFDKILFELASEKAQKFISENSMSEDDETKIKVATLRHLLFVVNDLDAKRYVPAKELTSILSEYVGRKIALNYFYRKIIASLRDDGLILASCPKGYKIPVSYNDIKDYIHSTTGIVGPMLNRLGNCRDLILTSTDGNLDILNEEAFLCYKKYFD